MWPSNQTEFLQELDATDEAHVRKKLALGGYTDWQVKAAEYWLTQRDIQRDEARAAQQLSMTRATVFWTRAKAAAAVGGFAITAFTAVLHYLATR
jgi:hypothetical protein